MYGAAMRLSLDHLTVIDADPVELVEAAHDARCTGVCLFIQSMPVLPTMPRFDLCADRSGRRDLVKRMADHGVTLDLAYPFTLAGRTRVEDYVVAMECAAELGAGLVNVLCYDREVSRRAENFAGFCDLAAGFDLAVAAEFYPLSQIGSLAGALDLVRALDRPGRVGVNVDLLHLMRSGGSITELAAAPDEFVLFAQACDGPQACPTDDLGAEASGERLLPGEGVFDVGGFLGALPEHCPVSVEIPRHSALLSGEPRGVRARRAVEAVRRAAAPVPPG
ncbi:sugar phosphate isomerase/epimerase [Novosphingobium sp. KN65.2]|uniref:sugar phosphate isomerase/epimerase family protein n=1 Tax=Novosphingobium sp. KN65.2 TaxID=1478134 RepID=UPI000A890601|nr:TIM barrel protein [Novosphingobium sp. KN65.2]